METPVICGPHYDATLMYTGGNNQGTLKVIFFKFKLLVHFDIQLTEICTDVVDNIDFRMKTPSMNYQPLFAKWILQ